MPDSVSTHKAQSPHRPIRCAVLTISDTRTRANDESGDTIETLAREAGHEIVDRRSVRDEPDAIGAALDEWIALPGVEVVLITGGTGISRRDNTIDIVRARLTTELEGFGELFRVVSFEEIGSAAMLSRAVAGLASRNEREAGDTFLFAMPGSPNAVRTAMTRLILPELRHLIGLRG